MNMKKRIELIDLLTEELTESAKKYEKAVAENKYVYAGCNIDFFDSKEAIKRRITVLRQELLELSKSL